MRMSRRREGTLTDVVNIVNEIWGREAETEKIKFSIRVIIIDGFEMARYLFASRIGGYLDGCTCTASSFTCIYSA